MSSISPKLPLQRDFIDGYASNKTLKDSIQQNFKCLMLTSPGERMMDPAFGVGLRRFLFEQSGTDLSSKIIERIHKQTKKYLPFIKILNVKTRTAGDSEAQSSSSAATLGIQITYSIIPLQIQDTLEMGINT